MPLSEFSLQSGEINWCAAIEQEVIHYGLWYKSTQWVLDVLRNAFGDQAARVVARKDQPPEYGTPGDDTPRFVRYVHNGESWLNVQGTYSLYQWQQNVVGVFDREEVADGVLGHGAWIKMAKAILDTPFHAADAWTKYPVANLSGNSLAAAVVWYVGLILKRAHPALKVNVMTFGCPRLVDTTAYDGVTPDVAFWVQMTGDPVVKVPTRVLSPQFGDWSRPGGKTYVLKDDGTLAAADYNAEGMGVTDALRLFTKSSGDGTLGRHYTSTYLAALDARLKVMLGDHETLFSTCPDTDRFLRAAGVIQGYPPLLRDGAAYPITLQSKPVEVVPQGPPPPVTQRPDGADPDQGSDPLDVRRNPGIEPGPNIGPAVIPHRPVQGGVCNY